MITSSKQILVLYYNINYIKVKCTFTLSNLTSKMTFLQNETRTVFDYKIRLFNPLKKTKNKNKLSKKKLWTSCSYKIKSEEIFIIHQLSRRHRYTFSILLHYYYFYLLRFVIQVYFLEVRDFSYNVRGVSWWQISVCLESVWWWSSQYCFIIMGSHFQKYTKKTSWK